MRILEATIAVMLVSGVLVVVYSRQVDRGVTLVDYFYSLQGQILSEISSRSDLRLAVLNVMDDDDDGNFTVVYNFVNKRVPDAFDFSLRVCDLGDSNDYCKMNSDVYISTIEKDVFVEEIIISSELGSGDDAVAPGSAKKLRFFIWGER